MTIHILGSILFGIYFFYSGFHHFQEEKALTGYTKSKGVPSPRLAVLLSGVLLMIGGLGFITNTYTSYSAALLIVFMVPTTFIMHAFWKTADKAHKSSEMISFMKNVALIAALLMALN